MHEIKFKRINEDGSVLIVGSRVRSREELSKLTMKIFEYMSIRDTLLLIEEKKHI
jgi:hypothetical protein